MIWREPKNHINDCYVCAFKTKRINRKNENSLVYPNLESAVRSISHCIEIPVPVFKGIPELELTGSEKDRCSFYPLTVVKLLFQMLVFLFYFLPQLFSQRKLNDLNRDLDLSKQSSELLASRLKEKILFQPETLITFYKERHVEFSSNFTQENDIV